MFTKKKGIRFEIIIMKVSLWIVAQLIPLRYRDSTADGTGSIGSGVGEADTVTDDR